MTEKVLLHICCAPCSVACVAQLREEGIEPTGFWYNPNIHPYAEYARRRDTLIAYADSIALSLIVQDEYGLRSFTRAVCGKEDARCAYCYACRLEETARVAAERGFSAIATTLTVSPYQNRALILETGARCAARHGVKFLPYDFSPRYWEGQELARELGLYRQKYCGCVYSEEEALRPGAKKPALPADFPRPPRTGPVFRNLKDDPTRAASLLPGACLRAAETVFALTLGETVIAAAAVAPCDARRAELFISVEESHRGQGCGKLLIKNVCAALKPKYDTLIAGTAEYTIPFFVKQGFDRYERTDSGTGLHYYANDLKRLNSLQQ